MTVKHVIHLLAAVGLTLTFGVKPAVAQDQHAGVKFGIDFADFGGNAENMSIRRGFVAGAFFGVDLSAVFRAGIHGQYVQKGAKADAIDVEELVFKLEYLELLAPLSVKAQPPGSFTPRFFAGPSLAFETNCKVAAAAESIDVDVDCDDREVGLATWKVDFGVFLGLGADVSLGAGAIAIEILYNRGLSDIGAQLKNRNIQITIGYALLYGNS